jgi:hypothetical protein
MFKIKKQHLLDDDDDDGELTAPSVEATDNGSTSNWALLKVAAMATEAHLKSKQPESVSDVPKQAKSNQTPAKEVEMDSVMKDYYTDIKSYVGKKYNSYKMNPIFKKSNIQNIGEDSAIEITLCSWCHKGIKQTEVTFQDAIHQGCVWKSN